MYLSQAQKLFSLRNIQENVVKLARMERKSSYADFDASTRWCMEAMKRAGFEKVERFVHPSDGKTVYGDCVMPQAWDLCGRSFLKITNESIPEDERILADSDENPVSAAIWSAPTAPGGVDAELVNYDDLDSENPDVKGKFVLFTGGNGPVIKGEVYRKMALAGAAGMAVTDFKAEKDCPYDIFWFNGQGNYGWYHVKEDPRMPVFSLPPLRTRRLVEQMKNEKIMVHAEMNTRIYDGEIYTVTGIIPGESTEEYVLFAHLYEPFEADDAIGFAASVEIGRVIKALNVPLKKTLRVVFSMEWYGVTAFLESCPHGKILAGMNMDACAINYGEKCCEFRLSPMSNPCFTDWFFRQAIRDRIPAIQWFENWGNLSDDTFAGDPGLDIPTNWLHNRPVRETFYHHNTGWLFGQVDWVYAERCCPALANALTVLLSAENFPDYTKEAVLEYTEECRRILNNPDRSVYTKEIGLKSRFDYQIGRLRSVRRFAEQEFDETPLRNIKESALKELEKLPRIFSPEEEAARHIVVSRNVKVPLCSLAKIPYAERKKVSIHPEIYALFDGKRTLLEVIRIFDTESGEVTAHAAIQKIAEILRYLEKYGYLKIN